jgi:hypothetical protein
MSFYEDREEEKEDVELRKRKQIENVFCIRV